MTPPPHGAPPDNSDSPLHWFPEFLNFRRRLVRAQVRMLSSSVLVGLVAGIAGIGFYLATQASVDLILGRIVGCHPAVRPAGEPRLGLAPEGPGHLHPWLLLLMPTIGGLLSGVLVYSFAPEAEGHGTDSVIAAYHYHHGLIRPRVPIIKVLASMLTLGSGGSGGREGPIAQIAAGFGSYLAGLLRFAPAERRVLMSAGMGAGIAAVFRAPLAGALFAAEVLYSSPEFEADVILPAALASVVSYCVFASAFGAEPLFALPPGLEFQSPLELLPYTLLALAMVILALLYTRTFYAVSDLFHRSSLPRKLRPALGGLLTGALGLALFYSFHRDPRVLAVLAFGYGAIQEALTGSLIGPGMLLAIALGKIVTTGLTIGSGGSAGVFGPSMVIGGCGGGALGMTLHALWPNLVPHPAAYAIVGMAGFFAAAAKTPFSTLIIVSEMTGGYQLLLPALWVCVLSFMLSDKQSIYSSQVISRSRSPAHRGFLAREVLSDIRVRQLIYPAELVLFKPQDSLAAVIAHFNLSNLPVLPVVDHEQALLGVIDLDDLYVAAQSTHSGDPLRAADLMREAEPLVPGDSLDEAMEVFVSEDLLVLPVVADRHARRVVGLVKRSAVAAAYLQQIHGPLAGDGRSDRHQTG